MIDMKIKDLPYRIKLLVFEKQKEQGNIPNENIGLSEFNNNFEWKLTKEKTEFWSEIDDGNYEPFKEKYGEILFLEEMHDNQIYYLRINGGLNYIIRYNKSKTIYKNSFLSSYKSNICIKHNNFNNIKDVIDFDMHICFLREANFEEKYWLKECEKKNKFIGKEDICTMNNACKEININNNMENENNEKNIKEWLNYFDYIKNKAYIKSDNKEQFNKIINNELKIMKKQINYD